MLATCPLPHLQDRARAVELAEVAAADSPGNRMEWRILGIARYRNGEYRDALTALERGDVGVLPEFAYYRALAHAQLDEREVAQAMLEEGERRQEKLQWRSPDLEELRNELGALLADGATK